MKRKSEFFLNRTKWLGHEIDETGIKPNKEKVKAILELKHPDNQKQLKSFLGAIQYLAKFYRDYRKRRKGFEDFRRKIPHGIGESNEMKILIT